MKNSGKGWVTAEYSMLPGASPERIDREAAKGKQSGRTVETGDLLYAEIGAKGGKATLLAALKAMGGLRAQAVPLCRAAHRRRGKDCALDDRARGGC
jgi:hypothetical protein